MTFPIITTPSESEQRTSPGAAPKPGMIWVPGGKFRMGSDKHYLEEAPEHWVTVDGFWMDQYPVTNADFRRFVDETGYVTFAEIAPDPADYPGALPEMLYPASMVFRKPRRSAEQRAGTWWHFVQGADWLHPGGPDTSISGLQNYPVVHVAYRDVEAYASWAGKEIPTEAEWEFAARGGLDGAEFAWGDQLYQGGRHMANTWQGEFPWQSLGSDGYEGTSPVTAFPPNGFGLYDMIGNTWEWTADWYTSAHAVDKQKACCTPHNPRGGAKEASYDPAQPQIQIPRKVLKGGSHLCAPNYCRRYRPAARFPHPVDTSTCHVSFRCIVRSVST